MVERFFLLWLCLLSGLAYWWPQGPGAWLGFDPFVASKPGIDWLFASTMLAIGWMLPRDELGQVLKRWPTVLFGTAVQYTAMPLLGWSVGRILGLGENERIGLVLVGCVPGAMASNVLTMAARGNVSYSVSLTTSSTLLSPIVVPWTLYLALGASIPLEPWKVCGQLCWTVVLPVLVGHLVGRSMPRWEAVAHRVGSNVAYLVIMWLIAVVVALNRDRLEPTPHLLTALLLVNLLGYAAGFLAGRSIKFDIAKTRALTLEIGMQNAGLGTIIALTHFSSRPQVAVPCALYTFGCVITAGLLAKWWTRNEPRLPDNGQTPPDQGPVESPIAH